MQAGIDATENRQGTGFELLKVTLRDHAGYFNAQNRQRIRGDSNGFRLLLDVLIVIHVFVELLPAGNQALGVFLCCDEPAIVEVVSRTVRHAEHDFLEAENHCLMNKLPLVRFWNRSSLDRLDQRGIEQFVLKSNIARHCCAVAAGEILAVVSRGRHREKFLANDCLGQRAGCGFGCMAGVKTRLGCCVDFRRDAGCLLADQIKARLVLRHAHHCRRFACGKTLGAYSQPFRATLNY